MKISIIIPAYNEEKYISKCLACIIKNAPNIYEIIVVDNASTDWTANEVRKFSNVKYIYEGKKWLTIARQTWYLAATWDIIAYIDADTRMPIWRYEKIIKYFEDDKELWFLSGPYYYYDAGIINYIWSVIYWGFFAYPIYIFLWYIWVGGNMIFRKDILDKMLWFDTNIKFYWEDTNAARRASKFAKCKFALNLVMPTSARRLNKQWTIKTIYIYVCNFFSEVINKKPYTSDYEDFR